jgi:hypothetical protein
VRILCPLPIQLSWRRIFEVLFFKPLFHLLKIIFLEQLGNDAFEKLGFVD